MNGEGRLVTGYLGLFAFLTLVIGGGTVKGLPTTFALELLCIPMVFMIRRRRSDGTAVGRPAVLILLALVALMFAVQLVPWGGGPLEPAQLFPEGAKALSASADAGRTLDSLAFVLCLIVLFFAIWSRTREQQNTILICMAVGFVLNMAVAFVQLASSAGREVDIFGYTMRAGAFSNPNHFSALLYVSIPFWVCMFDVARYRYLVLVPIGIVLLVEFAAGSAAGSALAVMAAGLSIATIWKLPLKARLVLITPLALGFVGLVAGLPGVVSAELATPQNRFVFASNTIDKIAEHIVLGTGFGTFAIVYPANLGVEGIYAEFVNHAHNDYLELLLEGGVLTLVAFALYAYVIYTAVSRYPMTPIRRAALLALIFILVHSLVDYPLRTFAMATLFAFVNAVLLTPDLEGRDLARTIVGGGRKSVRVS